jgi:hypothetical protein
MKAIFRFVDGVILASLVHNSNKRLHCSIARLYKLKYQNLCKCILFWQPALRTGIKGNELKYPTCIVLFNVLEVIGKVSRHFAGCKYVSCTCFLCSRHLRQDVVGVGTRFAYLAILFTVFIMSNNCCSTNCLIAALNVKMGNFQNL